MHSERGMSLHTCCDVSLHSWCGMVMQTFLSFTSHSSLQTSLQTVFIVMLQFSLTKGSHFWVVTTVGTYLWESDESFSYTFDLIKYYSTVAYTIFIFWLNKYIREKLTQKIALRDIGQCIILLRLFIEPSKSVYRKY